MPAHAEDNICLNCPSCSQLLKLDAGFAGAVCRCHLCHAMIRVPESYHPNASHPALNDPNDSVIGDTAVGLDHALNRSHAGINTTEASSSRSGVFEPTPEDPMSELRAAIALAEEDDRRKEQRIKQIQIKQEQAIRTRQITIRTALITLAVLCLFISFALIQSQLAPAQTDHRKTNSETNSEANPQATTTTTSKPQPSQTNPLDQPNGYFFGSPITAKTIILINDNTGDSNRRNSSVDITNTYELIYQALLKLIAQTNSTDQAALIGIRQNQHNQWLDIANVSASELKPIDIQGDGQLNDLLSTHAYQAGTPIIWLQIGPLQVKDLLAIQTWTATTTPTTSPTLTITTKPSTANPNTANHSPMHSPFVLMTFNDEPTLTTQQSIQNLGGTTYHIHHDQIQTWLENQPNQSPPIQTSPIQDQ